MSCWQRESWPMPDVGGPPSMMGVGGVPITFGDMTHRPPMPPPLWRGTRRMRRKRVAEYVREGLRSASERHQPTGAERVRDESRWHDVDELPYGRRKWQLPE